jgi:hypothetical protein
MLPYFVRLQREIKETAGLGELLIRISRAGQNVTLSNDENDAFLAGKTFRDCVWMNQLISELEAISFLTVYTDVPISLTDDESRENKRNIKDYV